MSEPKRLTEEELREAWKIVETQGSITYGRVIDLLNHIATLTADLKKWEDACHERTENWRDACRQADMKRLKIMDLEADLKRKGDRVEELRGTLRQKTDLIAELKSALLASRENLKRKEEVINTLNGCRNIMVNAFNQAGAAMGEYAEDYARKMFWDADEQFTYALQGKGKA